MHDQLRFRQLRGFEPAVIRRQVSFWHTRDQLLSIWQLHGGFVLAVIRRLFLHAEQLFFLAAARGLRAC